MKNIRIVIGGNFGDEGKGLMSAYFAEEMMQETFCRAIQSSFSVREDCKVSTWLCQIAKHIWYQELEKRKKYVYSPLDENLPSDEISMETMVIQTEEKMELFKNIHALKETEKEVVLLRLTGAFTFSEIGGVFEKNENWARVTFYRAKQKLISKMHGGE